MIIEDGDLILSYIIGPYDLEKYQDDTRKVLSFYINENEFDDNNSVHRFLECTLSTET